MFQGVASMVVWLGFPLLAGSLLLAVGWALGWAGKRARLSEPSRRRDSWRFVAVLGGWQLLVSAAAMSGLLGRFELRPPPLLLVLFGTAAVAQWLARSSLGRTLETLPLWALIAFQGFRAPLELLMHQAAAEGVMPPQMTWTGWNFDVLTGLTAPLVAWVVARAPRHRWLAVAWNAVGTALLVVVIVLAVASTPLFSAFGPGQAENTFVAFFPFTMLPTVMVLLAMAGHVVLWRKLRRPAA